DPQLDADHATLLDVAPQVLDGGAAVTRIDVAVAGDQVRVLAVHRTQVPVGLLHLVQGWVVPVAGNRGDQDSVDPMGGALLEHLGMQRGSLQVGMGVDDHRSATWAATSALARSNRCSVSVMSASVWE